MLFDVLAAWVAALEVVLLPTAFESVRIAGCYQTVELVAVGAPAAIGLGWALEKLALT